MFVSSVTTSPEELTRAKPALAINGKFVVWPLFVIVCDIHPRDLESLKKLESSVHVMWDEQIFQPRPGLDGSLLLLIDGGADNKGACQKDPSQWHALGERLLTELVASLKA
jgi:hypothetical protein